MNYGSPYTSSYASPAVVAENAPEVRVAFIRKVYGIFFSSLLVTVLAGAICAQPTVLPVVAPLLMPLVVVGFLLILGLSFARKTSGLNIGLLYLYSAIQGAILGPVLTMVQEFAPGAPAQAAAMTIAVFGCLSLYALQSKKDFSYLGGFLFVAIIALIVMGLFLMFFNAPFLTTLYCLAGVLIFSGFVLYDTSVIMRHLHPDEAIVGAINLYLDFLNLFWFILRLFMNRD